MEIPVGARERQLRISAPSHLKFIHGQLLAPFIVRLVNAQSMYNAGWASARVEHSDRDRNWPGGFPFQLSVPVFEQPVRA
jgi:hypothetical protein